MVSYLLVFIGPETSIRRLGGVNRYVEELADGLNDNGMQARGIAQLVRRSEFPRAASKLFPNAHDVSKFPTIFNPVLRKINLESLGKSLSSQPPDIYHSSYFGETPKFSNHTKFVLTVHDMLHEIVPEVFSFGDQARLFKRSNLNLADGVITISNYTREKLLQHFPLNPSKVRVIHQGMTRFERAEKRPFDDEYFLFVGSRAGYKNFDQLLEAIEHLRRLGTKVPRLVAFGGGNFTSRELSMLKAKNLLDTVLQLTGSDYKLAQLLSHAEALVYPSSHEGFGLTPLEAMSVGCPVVACQSGALPEVLGDAAIFFSPGSIDELARALVEVRLQSTREQLIPKGVLRSHKFSWGRTAELTAEFYSEVVTPKGNQR